MEIGAIISIIAIIVAFFIGFKEQILWCWYRPRLKVSITNASPDCHKTSFNVLQQTECYYFRLNIINYGRSSSRNVEVIINKLWIKEGSEFKIDNGFLPQNLLWSYIRKPVYNILSPQVPKHCDFGSVTKSSPNTKKGLFNVEVSFPPMNRSNVLGFGIYQLEVIIVADNVKPIKKILELNHSGTWYDKQEEMFEKGTYIEEV